jgi:hypothetical protein
MGFSLGFSWLRVWLEAFLVADPTIPFGDKRYRRVYQAMDLSRPKRMSRPRAAARRMAHVSVDRLMVERVLGVDMWSLLRGCAGAHEKTCGGGLEF